MQPIDLARANETPLSETQFLQASKKHGLQIYLINDGTVTMRQNRTTWVVAFLSETGPWTQ